MADIMIRGMEMPPKGKSICMEIFGAGGVHKFGECYPCALAYEVKTPHGRLIDADDLIDEMRLAWEYDEITNAEWTGIREWLNHAPTIVPAEGGGKDG